MSWEDLIKSAKDKLGEVVEWIDEHTPNAPTELGADQVINLDEPALVPANANASNNDVVEEQEAQEQETQEQIGEEWYNQKWHELANEHPDWSEQQVYDEMTRQINEADWNARYHNIIEDIANSSSPAEREQKIQYYNSELLAFCVSGIDVDNDLKYLRDTQGVEPKYILSPTDPAFVDATLSYRDIANGYHLEYNENGILWRIKASGEIHPDDLAKYQQQQEYKKYASDNLTVKCGMGIGGMTGKISQEISAVTKELTQTESALVQESSNAGLFRKTANIGEFKGLTEPMQLRHVEKIAKDAGIGLDDVKIQIERDPELIGRGIYGYTYPSGKIIRLYPDAFTDTETLVQTLGHERMHVHQFKVFGVPEDNAASFLYDDAAFSSEKDWWQYYLKGGK